MDYNHYIVIPEARSCYIDTIDYGRFDAFYSKNSKLNVTVDTYIAQDGVCVLNTKNAPLEHGSLGGDNFCQIFLKVEMPDCDGCPDHQRRIEVYSNRDTGCGMEFFVEPEVIPEPEPTPEPVEPEEPEEPAPTPTPAPEPASSTFLSASSMIAVASVLLMIDM